MCCSSKKKPIQPLPGNYQQTTYTPAVIQTKPLNKSIVTKQSSSFFNSNIPKSRLNFGANQFEPQVFNNQSKFVQTTRINNKEQDFGDRLQNYAVQNNQMNQSQLLMPKQLLTYDLDFQGGISEIPVLNTFHYQTQLNHLLVNLPASQIGAQNQHRVVSGIYNQGASKIFTENIMSQIGMNSKIIKKSSSILDTHIT